MYNCLPLYTSLITCNYFFSSVFDCKKAEIPIALDLKSIDKDTDWFSEGATIIFSLLVIRLEQEI